MNGGNGRADILSDALEAAAHLESATSVRCRVLDQNGAFRSDRKDGEAVAPCRLCGAVLAETGALPACRESHLYGSFQSMRFGGRSVYFCALGLTHLSAPLISEGRMIGALVAGPMVMVDPLELADEVAASHAVDPAVVEPLLAGFPSVTPKEARSIGEVLVYAASWVSGTDVQKLAEEEEQLSRESRVSDYIHQIKSMGGDATAHYPAETEAELLQTIREGDRASAEDLLDSLVASIRVTYGEDLATVRARVLELVVLLSRAAMDGGADAESVFGINFRAIEEIRSIDTIAELTTWLSSIVKRFVQFVFDVRSAGRSDVIIKATHAMRRRLGEKIGLDEIAGEVGLSPAYFSRIFKEETGVSFVGKLNDLRIERAKQLLRSTDRTILDIALEVGFSDQSHFSRVFRDRTDSSPARYRVSRGAYPSETQEIHDG